MGWDSVAVDADDALKAAEALESALRDVRREERQRAFDRAFFPGKERIAAIEAAGGYTSYSKKLREWS